MSTFRKKLLSTIAGIGLFASGCGPNWIDKVTDIGQRDYDFTHDQAETSLVTASRKRFFIEKDGKLVPNFKKIKLDDLIALEQEKQSDIDGLLDYRWDFQKLFEKYGVREKLEKREEVVDFSLRTYREIVLSKQFKEKMGFSNNHKKKNKIYYSYNLGTLWPFDDKGFSFSPKYDSKAKVRKILEEIDFSIKFEKKIKNPEFPKKDKIKKHLWIPAQAGIKIVSEDLNDPTDRNSDVITVYRKNENGILESKPAIKVYKPMGKDFLSVAVVDLDRETEKGYGEPDLVLDVRVRSEDEGKEASEFYRDYGYLFKKLFEDKTKYRRIKPIEDKMRIEIVEYGDLDNRLWVEDKVTGFAVPFEYVNDRKDNFNLIVHYKERENQEEPEDPFAPKEIDFFVKKYYDPEKSWKDVKGRVIEFCRLKDQYKPEDITDIVIYNRKWMLLTLKDGTPKRGLFNMFLEENPFAIEYDYGDCRFRIEDKDNSDTPLYESQKKQIKPMSIKEFKKGMKD